MGSAAIDTPTPYPIIDGPFVKILNLKIVACNVMWRELCYYASLSPNKFEFNFLP